MQRETIQWSRVLRKDSMPGDLPRFGNQIKGCGRQCRHVQRLANMAGGLRPTASVLVDERPTAGKIQQSRAPQ